MILTDFWFTALEALAALCVVVALAALCVVPCGCAIDWISFTNLDKSDILYGRYFVYALGV